MILHPTIACINFTDGLNIKYRHVNIVLKPAILVVVILELVCYISSRCTCEITRKRVSLSVEIMLYLLQTCYYTLGENNTTLTHCDSLYLFFLFSYFYLYFLSLSFLCRFFSLHRVVLLLVLLSGHMGTFDIMGWERLERKSSAYNRLDEI